MGKKITIKKKQIFTAIGIVVLLGAALVAGALVQRLTVNQDSEQEFIAEPLPQQAGEAQQLRDEGNEAEALEHINESLADPSLTDETRYTLYVQQGHTYMGQSRWEQAIEAYLQAESIQPSKEAADLLAEAYRANGDNQSAIEYYRKAIERIPRENPRYEGIKQEIEDKIREIGGQP